jgi:NTE family protein
MSIYELQRCPPQLFVAIKQGSTMKKANVYSERSFAIGRRELVLATAAALVLSSRQASSQTPESFQNAQPKIVFKDNLAVPIPANPSFGKGKDRALVLGGGGEYFAAWMLGFAHGLNAKGVPYQVPDIIVGTSAGSVVGSAIAGSHLERLTREFDFFGRFPTILAALVPTPTPNPSQIRARELCKIANDGSIETIQSIGRGAMGAKNPAVSKLQDMIGILTGNRSWPSPKFHATTMDCYTGERLVVSEADKIPIAHAASASMSLPGIFGPTWIGDRICMDGGMSPTSTHSDLVAGAKRALVVSLTDGTSGSGPRLSNIPNALQRELRDLEAAGTKTFLIAANPGQVNLVSPAEIRPALRAGYDRAVKEADRVKAFWA